MQKKKGISLIVLVITIIVMIILAATIILSISNNNVVQRAEEAVDASNLKQVQELAQMAWAEAYMSGKTTKTELEKEVLDVLKDNKVDTTKYSINVTESGVTVSAGSALNEYGFYFGKAYVGTFDGEEVSVTFFEDGSAIMTELGVRDNLPTGTFEYEVGEIYWIDPDGSGLFATVQSQGNQLLVYEAIILTIEQPVDLPNTNEYGFYYDKLYFGTLKDATGKVVMDVGAIFNDNNKAYAFVDVEDGAYCYGVIDEVYSQGTITSELITLYVQNNGINLTGEIVSNDGDKTLVTLTCDLSKEAKSIYKNRYYTGEANGHQYSLIIDDNNLLTYKEDDVIKQQETITLLDGGILCDSIHKYASFLDGTKIIVDDNHILTLTEETAN